VSASPLPPDNSEIGKKMRVMSRQQRERTCGCSEKGL
jgi:hypothetical protein